MGLSMTMSATLQGWGRFDLANLVTVSSVVVQVGGALLALNWQWGLLGVIGFAISGSLVAALVGLWLLRSGAPGLVWGSPRRALARVREVIAFGGPLQIGNILGVAHQQLDKVLLSRYVALALVAPYELGLRMATVLGSLPQQMLMALIPQVAGFHALGDDVSLRAAHARAARWVMTITATLSAGLLVGGPRLLTAWLGTPPVGAERALAGLTLAMVVAMTTGTGTAIARAMGRTRYEAEYSGVGLVAHLVLGLSWVPGHGLDGALLATLVANALASAWFLLRFAHTTGWGFGEVFGRPAIQPLLALVLVVAVGRASAPWLPEASGVAQWAWAVLASAMPALGVVALLIATRFLPLSEVAAVLRQRAPEPQE
jgi:O-antigen/teichoic acid export membrane protein